MLTEKYTSGRPAMNFTTSEVVVLLTIFVCSAENLLGAGEIKPFGTMLYFLIVLAWTRYCIYTPKGAAFALLAMLSMFTVMIPVLVTTVSDLSSDNVLTVVIVYGVNVLVTISTYLVVLINNHFFYKVYRLVSYLLTVLAISWLWISIYVIDPTKALELFS